MSKEKIVVINREDGILAYKSIPLEECRSYVDENTGNDMELEINEVKDMEDKPFIPFDPKQAMYGAPLRLEDPNMEVTFASAKLTEDTGCLKKICVLIKDKDNKNYCGFFCNFDENGKDLSEGNRQLFMDDSECGTRRLPFSLEAYNKETDEILDLEGNRITILDIINDKRLPVVAKKTYPDGSEEVETYTLDGHTTSCQTYEITSTNLVIRRQDQSFDMNRILQGYPATTLEGYSVEPVRYLKDDKLLVARIKKGNEILETTFDKDGKALKGNLYGYDLELKMKPAKDYYLIPFDYNIFSGKGIKAVTRNGKEVIYVNIKDNGTGIKTITAQVRDFEGKTKTISLTKKKDDNSFFNELLLKVPVSK